MSSYGTLFLPAESRLKPDIGKFYKEIYSEALKEKTNKFDHDETKKFQMLGKLLDTGCDSKEVMAHVNRKKEKSLISTASENISNEKSNSLLNKIKLTTKPKLNISGAIVAFQSQRKELFDDNYETSFQVVLFFNTSY
jgi:hypothetical protein